MLDEDEDEELPERERRPREGGGREELEPGEGAVVFATPRGLNCSDRAESGLKLDPG